MRRDCARALLLGLACVIGLACSSSHEGETCGSIAGIRCATDEYCDFTDNECGIADGGGTCKRRPEACPDIFRPTCACNGQVYGSECDAAAHGFDVSTNGNCQAPAGYFMCGGGFCDLSMYCRRESDPSGMAAFGCVRLPSGCSSSASCGCVSAEDCGESCTGDAQDGLTLTCP
ncbi:MAG TPA: hypothetical protein VLM79_05655 [Kofleriaceae bacterium]|nr:hypothetical protein [Kofleriaceae bacterium]